MAAIKEDTLQQSLCLLFMFITMHNAIVAVRVDFEKSRNIVNNDNLLYTTKCVRFLLRAFIFFKSCSLSNVVTYTYVTGCKMVSHLIEYVVQRFVL